MKKQLSTVLVIGAVAIAAACATTSATPASGTALTSKPNPNLISTAEIDATANLRDAYDAVQRLRPTWITRSQSSSMSISGNREGAAILVVYLDHARLGDLSTLHDIQSSAISTIQFLDASTAMATLQGIGSTLISGAIVVHSRAMQ